MEKVVADGKDVGTMIEIPRAALLANEIAEEAEKGRSVRPDIKRGICGEHGGDFGEVI